MLSSAITCLFVTTLVSQSSFTAWFPSKIPSKHRASSSTDEKNYELCHDDEPWCECSRREFLTTSSSLVAATTAMMSTLSQEASAEETATLSTKSTTPPLNPLVPLIPFSTRRQYKDVTLANGLRVLLVRDKKAPRASAALTIQGAGQFAESPLLGGLAHLMEHMASSSSRKQDFEDWLEELNDGTSNAFTGPDMVCFHFNVETDCFAEALTRFSWLFEPDVVERTCRNDAILKREIRRVDSELDFQNEFNQALYLLKSVVNPQHPFSRFTQGSITSLERIPMKLGIDVSDELVKFFGERYLASKAALVVVSPSDLDSMERWVSPFASTLNSRQAPTSEVSDPAKMLPTPFTPTTKPTQFILWRPKGDSPQMFGIEKLSLHWFLERKYDNSNGPIVLSTTTGFFLSQLIARRGPGSLYLFLLRRGWIPEGTQGLPRITFPIDTDGFQLMKLDIGLTMEGFANRSAVLAAFYDCLQAIVHATGGTYDVSEDLLKQDLTICKLYGYDIAPRPPDAVELSVDAQRYGIGGTSGVGVEGVFPLLPLGNEPAMLFAVQKSVAEILEVIAGPQNAVVVLTASNRAILQSRSSLIDAVIPAPLLSDRWKRESVSGARYLAVDLMSFSGFLEEWITNRLEEEEIRSPTYNPLIPRKLRAARPIKEQALPDGSTRLFYMDDDDKQSIWREFSTKSSDSKDVTTWEDRALVQEFGSSWQVFQTTAVGPGSPKLPLPLMPPEPTCRTALVLQLLSSRPARARPNQAAAAELWIESFHDAIQDLAELGSPAGLSYDLCFNKFGLRICILGLSQNIGPFTRRFARRFVNHHNRMMLQSSITERVTERAISSANRQPSLSLLRKRKMIGMLRETSSQEASREGKAFLQSCAGAMCLVQGDYLPKEALTLAGDLKSVFDRVTHPVDNSSTDAEPAVPRLAEILYKPIWKPRSSSLCSIAGVPLIADPCGRVRR